MQKLSGWALNVLGESHSNSASRFVRRRPVAIALIAVLPLAAFLVDPTIQGDDWRHYNDESAWQYRWGVRNGRPLFSLGLWLLNDGGLRHPWSQLIFAAALVTFAVTLAVRLSDHDGVRLIASALLTCSPLLVENYQFSVNHGGLALGFLLMALVAKLTPAGSPTIGRMAAVGLLAGFASLARQDFLLIALAVVATLLFVSWNRPDSECGSRPVLLGFSSFAIAAVATYLAIAAVMRGLYDLEAPTSGAYTTELALAPSQLVSQFERMGRHIVVYLFQAQAHIPLVMKLATLLLLGGVVATLVSQRTHMNRAGAVALTVVLLVMPFAIGLVREPDSYRYSGMGGLQVFLPVVFLLACAATNSVRLRNALTAVAAVVALLGAVQLFDAGRHSAQTTRQDLALMSQIAADADLHEHPDRRIVLYGTCTGDEDRDFGWDWAVDTPPDWTATIIKTGSLQCQRSRANSAYNIAVTGTSGLGPNAGPFVQIQDLPVADRRRIRAEYTSTEARQAMFVVNDDLWVYFVYGPGDS